MTPVLPYADFPELNAVDQIMVRSAVCRDTIDWVRRAAHPTPQVSWDNCPDGRLMLCYAFEVVKRGGSVDRSALARIACDAAEALNKIPRPPTGSRVWGIAADATARCLAGTGTREDAVSAVRASRDTWALYARASFMRVAWQAAWVAWEDADVASRRAARAPMSAALEADAAEAAANAELVGSFAQAARTEKESVQTLASRSDMPTVEGADAWTEMWTTNAWALPEARAAADIVRRHMPHPPPLP